MTAHPEGLAPPDGIAQPHEVARFAPSLVPFAVVAAAAIVAGGLAAAVAGPTGWSDGSWVAAYLVLVAGVGQAGLGAGQAAFAIGPTPRRRLVAQLATFNGGSLLVLVGTLVSRPEVVTVGCLVFAGALAIFAAGARAGGDQLRGRRVYAGLLVLLSVSTPIGAALSWIRA